VYKKDVGDLPGTGSFLHDRTEFSFFFGAAPVHTGNGVSLPPTWLQCEFEVVWHCHKQAAAHHVSKSEGTV